MPSSQLHLQRRPAPEPSPSLLAMQQKGLELTTKDVSSLHIGGKVPHLHINEGTESQGDHELVSPFGSYPTRSSSIYSTESVHSGDSARTTISQILDMYIDLVSKLPGDNDRAGATVVQPTAYRDTIAPLLRRRFSTESEHPSSTWVDSCPIPPILPLQISSKHSQASLSSSYKQAPGFQEFSRNLRDRRAELVSPLTTKSSDRNSQSTLEASSEPSPTTPQLRPFSFVSNDKTGLGDCPTALPLLDAEASNAIPSVNSRGIQDNHHEEMQQHIQMKHPSRSRYVKSQDLLAQTSSSKQSDFSHQPMSSPRPDESSRFYRHRSTGSRSTDSFVMYSGIGETVKAMIKDKIQRRREAKETASILTTASHKYPGMQQQPIVQPSGRRKSSLKDSVEHVLSRMSVSGSNDDDSATVQPERRERQAAIPLTPYQKYGADIWLAKNKKKRKEERQRERERQGHKSQEIRPEHRPKSSGIYRPHHRRTSSARTTGTIPSPTAAGKRNGLIAAVESAKHSFTHSSAEKRRDKLKESIVLVGPAQLTVFNAQADGNALR